MTANEQILGSGESTVRPYGLRTEIALVCLIFAASLIVHLLFLYPSRFDGLYCDLFFPDWLFTSSV